MEEVISSYDTLFTEEDIQHLEAHGITQEEALRQIELMRSGTTFQVLELSLIHI